MKLEEMKLIDILVEELPKTDFGWPPKAETCYNIITINTKYNDHLKVIFTDGKGNALGFDVAHTPLKHQEVITREQYEAALAAKNYGWIEWCGGECPANAGEMVDVIFGHGGIMSTNVAGCWNWHHNGTRSDIIAYRLHQPQKSAQVKADDEADLNECIGQDAAPVWNGEGLPPVGCECEVSVDGGRSWCTYKAINEKNGARLIEIGNFTEEFQNNNWIFRPICSEAEKKRDEAVKTIMLTGWCQTAAEEIYDLVAAGKVPGMKLED